MLMAKVVNQKLRTGVAIDMDSIDGDFSLAFGVDLLQFLASGHGGRTMFELKSAIVTGGGTNGLVFRS